MTAEKVAVNAVMAGGLPLHFPAIVTALSAMLRDEFSLHGATASTGGCAVFIVINGDERLRLGMDGTFNALGNSDRASAVVGRAVRLCLINLFDVRPGGIDRSTLGHPGKFSFCIAEDEEGSPLGVARRGARDPGRRLGGHRHGGGRPAPDHERMDHRAGGDPRDLRGGDAGQHAPVLHLARKLRDRHAPQLRDHFAAAGWSRADVRERIFERARIHRREWATVGKGEVVGERGDREYRALPDPDHLLLVAAGGPAGGFGAVIPALARRQERAVTLAVGACLDCEVPEADGAPAAPPG